MVPALALTELSAPAVPGTPRSSRVGVRELRVERHRMPRSSQGSTDPLGLAPSSEHGFAAPLTERGLRQSDHREDCTSLYGVPLKPDPPRGRRLVAGPGNGELDQEPEFEHLRRLPGPGSSAASREPAMPRRVHVGQLERVAQPEGIRVFGGLPGRATHVAEIVFGAPLDYSEAAEAEFERLLALRGSAGLRPSPQAPPLGIKTFPLQLGRCSEEQASRCRRASTVVGQPSPRIQASLQFGEAPRWECVGPQFPSDEALAQAAAQRAAGRQPPPEFGLEGRLHLPNAPAAQTRVAALLRGQQSQQNSLTDFAGVAGFHDAGEESLRGLHVFPGAAPGASRVDEVLFGVDLDGSNTAAGAGRYEALFVGAAGHGAALLAAGEDVAHGRHAFPGAAVRATRADEAPFGRHAELCVGAAGYGAGLAGYGVGLAGDGAEIVHGCRHYLPGEKRHTHLGEVGREADIPGARGAGHAPLYDGAAGAGVAPRGRDIQPVVPRGGAGAGGRGAPAAHGSAPAAHGGARACDLRFASPRW